MLTLIPICRFQIIITWDIKADSTVSNLTVDNSTVYISRQMDGMSDNKINNN